MTDVSEQLTITLDRLASTAHADRDLDGVRSGRSRPAAAELECDSNRPRRRGALLSAAAAIILAAGAGGLAWLTREGAPTNPETVVDVADQVANSQPTSGPLFLLPEPSGARLVLANAAVESVEPDFSILAANGFGPGLLIGLPVSEVGFTRLLYAGVSSSSPIEEPDAWNEVMTDTGTAFTRSTFLSTVAQQRGDTWLVLESGSDPLTEALDLLDHVEVDEEGRIEVGDIGQSVVVDTIEPPDATDLFTTTYYDVTESAAGSTFVVETFAGESAVVGMQRMDRAERIEINGIAGWLGVVDDADPEDQIAVTWRVSPNRVAAVSGHGDVAELVNLAERLSVVNETEWRSRFDEVDELS